MEKFDLFKAIHGHPLCTRNGREVLEFHYFKTAKKYNITVLICGDSTTTDFDSDGCFSLNNIANKIDLYLDTSKEWIPTFKTGEMIEVLDRGEWIKRRFLFYINNVYYCPCSNNVEFPVTYKEARPIYPSEELKIDITIKCGGRILRPEDFSKETWSKLRK